MAFDYKKEYKEFYMPKAKPELVTVPRMNYLAVRGTGDPNMEGGAYKEAIGLLYGVAFTVKMSKKGIIRLKAFLIMSYLRWRGSGGRRTRKALITAGRETFAGFP